MKKLIVRTDYKSSSGNVKALLVLMHFEDENGIHFVYSPHLDLTGYGNTLREAKYSFEIVFEDFLDYTVREKTLKTIMKKLGWTLADVGKRKKEFVFPELDDLIKSNSYVANIYENYKVNIFNQEVGIPAYAY